MSYDNFSVLYVCVSACAHILHMRMHGFGSYIHMKNFELVAAHIKMFYFLEMATLEPKTFCKKFHSRNP